MQSQKQRKADIAKNIYPETCRETSTTTNAVIPSCESLTSQKTITFTMNSSDELPLPITTSRILQRVAGFFSSRPDVVKENSYYSRPQTLGKKLQPNTQIKGEKKRKKSNAFNLLRRRPMTTSWIVAKSATKKILPRPGAIEDNSYRSGPQTLERKTLQTKCSKAKKKKRGGKSNSLTLLQRR